MLTKTEQNWTEFRSEARESWRVCDVCSERCQTTSRPLQASLRAVGLPALCALLDKNRVSGRVQPGSALCFTQALCGNELKVKLINYLSK